MVKASNDTLDCLVSMKFLLPIIIILGPLLELPASCTPLYMPWASLPVVLRSVLTYWVQRSAQTSTPGLRTFVPNVEVARSSKLYHL